MEPHGLAGWTADKAYSGTTLMRYMKKQAPVKEHVEKVEGYGNVGHDIHHDDHHGQFGLGGYDGGYDGGYGGYGHQSDYGYGHY